MGEFPLNNDALGKGEVRICEATTKGAPQFRSFWPFGIDEVQSF